MLPGEDDPFIGTGPDYDPDASAYDEEDAVAAQSGSSCAASR